MKPDKQWQYEESLIRVAYGDAGLTERLRVRRLVGRDAQARQLFEQHQRLARGARALRQQRHSPERVLLRTLDVCRTMKAQERRNRSFSWITATAALGAMALAVVIGAQVMHKQEAPGPALVERNEYGLTPQEMKQARMEAEVSLRLLGTALASAGTLSQQIAEDAMAPRISHGLEQARNIIFNESGS